MSIKAKITSNEIKFFQIIIIKKLGEIKWITFIFITIMAIDYKGIIILFCNNLVIIFKGTKLFQSSYCL